MKREGRKGREGKERKEGKEEKERGGMRCRLREEMKGRKREGREG